MHRGEPIEGGDDVVGIDVAFDIHRERDTRAFINDVQQLQRTIAAVDTARSG